MRRSGKAGLLKWTGWPTQFAKTTDLKDQTLVLFRFHFALALNWTLPRQRCYKGNGILTLSESSNKTLHRTESEQSLTTASAFRFQDSSWKLSASWIIISCWPCTPRNATGVVFCVFCFLFKCLVLSQKGVNTSFLNVMTKYCHSANNLSTPGSWELFLFSKWGLKISFLPFLNYVNYKL